MGPVFKKLFLSEFTRSHLHVLWDSGRRTLPESLLSAMDAFWQESVLKSMSGEHLFNGDLCRLNSWEIDSKEPKLSLGYTNYKELLYSNHRIQSGNDIPFGHLSYALGISAVLISSDAQIILIRRSPTVGEFPDTLDILGGHIHPTEHAVAGTPAPFVAMQAEIDEEMGVKSSEYSLQCIGLLETIRTRKPELIFVADCKLSAKRVLERGQAKHSPEVAAILTVAPDSLSSFLETRGQEFSPSAYGGLCLYAEFIENA